MTQSFTLSPEELLKTARQFQKESYLTLLNLTAVDRGQKFEIIYELFSLEKNQRITLKTSVSRGQPELPSLTKIYRNANWYERELFDLLGIIFKNHPHLKRILLPENWQGFPLRKDYFDQDTIPLLKT